MPYIDGFDIFKFPSPLGRTIGDNSCSYNEMVILAICLRTNEGHVGWGYSEVMTTGNFVRKAWWVRQLPEVVELKNIFKQSWWPKLYKQDPLQLRDVRRNTHSSETGIDKAVRLALWDLIGLHLEKPLYKILGGDNAPNEKKAYGSPLDFHISNEETEKLVKKFISRGFTTIKTKVGAPDAQRDIDRLLLIQAVAGSDIALTADANEAWDWQTSLQRLEEFEKAGIQLSYLEDPIYRTDIDGIKELTTRSPIPIIGNDYLDNVKDVEHLIKKGGIQGIRTFKDFDYMQECIELAKVHRVPVYIGNSQFEVSVHVAVAYQEVEMIEFADLGWNDLVIQPIKFENGNAIAPNVPGHGLHPKPELLNGNTQLKVLNHA